MLRSMTGYGRGECLIGERKFSVEIKSVNHRYNDISIKLPRGMAEFEDTVKKLLLEEITRGKTDVYISFETFSKSDIVVKFNEPLADVLVDQLKEMKNRFNTTDGISLNILTRFSEILTVEKGSYGQETKDACLSGITYAVTKALEVFINMRKTEGQALKNDILGKLSNIHSSLETIKIHAPLVVDTYRDRLTQRLNDMLGSNGIAIDENRIMAEVLIFADKACIDEEVTRLSSHIGQMKTVLDEDDAIGRKLDFIAQEMNREINTIGSKANDISITAAVVELKSELEKIREQIQNIE